MLLDFLPAFLVDFAAYVAIFTLQQRLDAKLLAAGAPSEVALAVLVGCWQVTYVLGCVAIGPITDRPGLRRKAITAGALLSTVIPIALLAIDRIRPDVPVVVLDAAMVLIGLSSALFWPAQQARVAERSGRASLGAALARFNVGWTAGKASGLFFAGTLWKLGKADGSIGLGIAALAFGVALGVTVVFDRANATEETQTIESKSERPISEKRGFLVAALVTNCAVWGLQATVISLVPELGRELSVGPEREGQLLATLVLAQALVFLVLRGTGRWTYKRWPVLATAPLAVFAALAFFIAPTLPWAFGAAAAIGLLTGASYAASLFYSLDYDERRGLRMGINEAVLGLGGSLVPLCGSALAERAHEPRLPYLFGAWVSFGAAVVSGFALRRKAAA